MKKLLLIAAVLVASLSAYAQGTINFNNRIGTGDPSDSPVFDVGGVTRLAGAGFFAQLYAGPAGSAAGALAAVGAPVTFRTGGGAGYVNSPGDVTTAVGGATAAIQMRAWDSAFPTYAAALAGGGKTGASIVFDSLPLGGGGSPPATAPNLTGLRSFSLVPEPSTIALGALGMAALLLRRRK